MDRKRIIFAIIFFFVTILIGISLYIVFFRTTTPTDPKGVVSPSTDDTSGFPSANPGDFSPIIIDGTAPTLPIPTTPTTQPGLFRPSSEVRTTQLFDDQIISPNIHSNNNISFYNTQDGRFYSVGRDGRLEQLSDQVFFSVQDVTWNPTTNAAILEYPDGAKIYYDFDQQRQVTLPKHWEEFSFSTDGGKIAAKSIGLSPENRWLITSNPDGSNTRLIEPLGENADKVDVNWSPNQQVVGFSRTGAALGANREEVLLVGQNGENFKSLIVEGRGFESIWAPQGDKIAYSVFSARNDFKPELWVVNANPNNVGANRQLLRVNTWAEKCSFDPSNQRFLYCGVPERLDTGAGFQPGLADTIPDRLYRIDTQSGIQTEIPLDSGLSHTIDTINISADGKNLIFTDKQNNGLFEVSL